MSFDRPINSRQLSMLAKVLNDCCTEAGIPKGHPAREHFGRRLMALYQSGVDQPQELTSKMNASYEEWLGETGTIDHLIRPDLSSEDRRAGDGILPGSDRGPAGKSSGG